MKTLNKLLWLSVATTAFVTNAQEITGVVKDEQGNAIAGAKISIINGKRVVIADSGGRFTFTDLPDDKVELHVTADDFSHKNISVLLTDQSQVAVDILLSPSVMEVIDVHATPLHSSTIESALPVNVIAADELRMKHASTLGETLANEVGVHSSYYGPVSSSPIIRGLDGPRVLITQNGLDVGDVSRSGPDHVVSSETANAQQIEVLRGPATLFYGSGAIGGVVNIVDNRVPREVNSEVAYLVKHNTVADENEASFAIDTGKENIAIHLDGFWRDSGNYKIPGLAEVDELHSDEHPEEDHDELEEHEDQLAEGILPNSASSSKGFTIGASYLLDNGYIGFSYGNMSREYGIPGHSHAEHDEEHDEHEENSENEEQVLGDLTQDRFQLLSELNFDDKFLSALTSKFAYTDYQHKEIENGEVGTTFNNEMTELRFDLYHKEVNGWKGAWTLHYKEAEFEAIGDEAFTPISTTDSIAFAWLEEKHFDDVLLQLGARIEHVTVDAYGELLSDEHHDEHEENVHGDEEHDESYNKQSFNPYSLSAGLVWDYQQGYNLGMSLSYSQRAPSSAEIFANGPHIGTNTFELGALYHIEQEGEELHIEIVEADIKKEAATNLDITWRKFEGDFGFVISAFYNRVDNYFYQQDTGFYQHVEDEHQMHEEEQDEAHDEHDDHEAHQSDLPIFKYNQSDVIMKGIEAEFIYQITDNLKVNAFTDVINAKLVDGGYLPRIPPFRLGGQLQYQNDNYAAEFSITHFGKQDKLADYETATDGYTLVNANFSYYLNDIGNDLVLFIKGKNLTDEDARVHSSFLKDLAPLPGRGVEFGIRGSF